MSTPSDDPEAGPEPTTTPANKTPTIVLALLGLNLALTGLVAFKTLTGGGHSAPHVATAAADTPEPLKKEVTGPVVSLDPFVVNLNEPGSARYLKVTMQAELADRASARVFEKSKQLIRDEMLSYLSGLRVADTLGPENKDKIRDDLEVAVTDIIGAERLHRMIFAEFVVQ